MKVFISVDIEGATGIASFSQCGRADATHYDYAFARRMLTSDVNAAIRGARAAGATDVVVKDAHGNCKNLLIDELEPGTQLISGFYPRDDYMMDGLDSGFDAAMLVGYHAMAGAVRGMMEHALTGGLYRFWINDRPAGEIAMSALVAAEMGVPVVFVSSDSAGCEEAEAAIPGVRTYATKTAFGKYMGKMTHPSETDPAIEGVARAALLQPPSLVFENAPISMRCEFRTTNEADTAEKLPCVRRVDGYSIETSTRTVREGHQQMLAAFQMSMIARQAT